MSDWKLHIPNTEDRITRYQCGLVAGQRVRLKQDLVIKTYDGIPTGKIHPAGEEWVVLTGISTDPVLWFAQPNGEQCTWDDDATSVDSWFDRS